MTPQERALRCAEVEFEAALIAVSMATDSTGRRVVLLPWNPLAVTKQTFSSKDIRERLLKFHHQVADTHAVIMPDDGSTAFETEARVIKNTRLLLNAWEAALNYERAKAAV
jgi:hypothetical protein